MSVGEREPPMWTVSLAMVPETEPVPYVIENVVSSICILSQSLLPAFRKLVHTRTFSVLESPSPNVLCLPHASVPQSSLMTHVLLAAESSSK